MVCFQDFEIKFPVADEEVWREYVLVRYYGLTPERIEELTRWKHYSERISGTTKIVTFKLSSHLPLVLVLPNVIVNENAFDPPQDSLIAFAKRQIGRCLAMVRSDLMMYSSEVHDCTMNQLQNLIRSLTYDSELCKFLQVSVDKYYVVCSRAATVLTMGIKNGQLIIDNLNGFATFDIDDGFCSCGGSFANDWFQQWKEIGDITQPIFPSITFS